ncbi:23629_t:CDS:1, partial [Racocetra persica]
ANLHDFSCPCRILRREEIQAVLFSMHDDPLAEHFGFEATYQ